MTDRTKILGVVLAGGKGTRIGNQDKGLLKINSKTLIQHAIERLSPQVADVIINANGDPNRFRDQKKQIVPDTALGFQGPLAGILAGLDHAIINGYSSIVSVAVDTPFFPKDLVRRLIKTANNHGGLSISSSINNSLENKKHPTFGIWPCRLRDSLSEQLLNGNRKIIIWTDKHNAGNTIYKINNIDPFFNINTIEDLQYANSMSERFV